ncbi:MAG TPA: translocation/assembly module TamB domain-containing protein, partial [Candidatus Binataceae bacterium]
IHPRARLATNPDGRWNVVAAFTPRNPVLSNQGTSYRVSIHRFKIIGADVDIEHASRKWRLSNARLEASAQIQPRGLEFQLHTLDSRIDGAGLPETILHTEFALHQTRGVASATLSTLSLRTQASEIEASATLADLAKLRGEGVVHIRKLAASDLRTIDSRLDLARDIVGTINIKGEISAARLQAAISAAGARTVLNARARASGGSYDYDASLSLSGLNAGELFHASRNQRLPRGPISGVVHAQGNMRDFSTLHATADLRGDKLAIGQWRLGNLVLTGKLFRQVASVEAQLVNSGSRSELTAAVNLKGRPSYRAVVTMSRIDLRSFAVQPGRMPASDLNARATLRGTGTDTHTAEAEATLQFSRSTAGTIKIDRGSLTAELAQGVLQFREASVEALDASLTARGTVAVSQGRQGSFTYTLRIGAVGPWLALAGHRGSGRIELAGTVGGTADQLRARGWGQTSAFQMDTYSAQHARVAYDVTRVQSANVQGHLELTAESINASTKFKSIASTVQLNRGLPQTAQISLNAIDEMSRPDHIDARLVYQPDDLRISLATVLLTTQGGAWRLQRVAEVRVRNRELQVQDFVLTSGNQSLTIDGVASGSGAQNLRVSANRVSLGALAAMSPKPIAIEGLLSVRSQVSGTAAEPLVHSTATIDDLSVSGLRYQGFDADFSYAARKALVDVSLRQDDSHSLRANGTIPVALAWSPRFQAEPAGEMDLRATSQGIDLTFLNAFTAGSVHNLEGTLAVDVTARGTVKDPRLQGHLDLSAKFLIKPLNVYVREAVARIEVDPHQIRLANLRATAGDGILSGRGTIDLERYSPRQLSVAVSFDKWPAIATQEYSSTIAGAVNCSGPTQSLSVSGAIESLSGLVRPDISLFQQQSLKPDETIQVAQSDVEQKPPTAASTPTGPAPPSGDVAIDLGIQIDRNNWIKTDEAQIELQGKLQVKKPTHASVDVTGVIHTVQGNVRVASKSFDLVRGDINFVGGAGIDPLLDIRAQKRVQNYTVSADITGPASKPNLALSSSPPMEQADILAMVMFGRPVSKLNGSQQQNLQNQAMQMAASQAGRAIADSLGLEDIGITTTETGGVGVGRYVGQNIYLSASQETVDPRKRRGAFSYHLTPEININTSTSVGYGNQIELQWHKDY